MNQGVPDFEGRLAPHSTPLDPLAPLRRPDSAPEVRLTALADECADIVRRWATLSERHARAVTRFETQVAELTDTGARLQQDATERLAALERLVRDEWRELRLLHEEPIRQLGEHATSLTQVCIATASVAQQGFERSEARLTAIEQELHRRLTDVTRELQAAAADLRHTQTTLVRPAEVNQSWSLDGVTRLHHQLRTGDMAARAGEGGGESGRMAVAPPPVAALLPEAAGAMTDRLDAIERTLADRAGDGTSARWRRATWLGVAALVAALTMGGAALGLLRRDVREATARAARAEAAQEAAAAAAAQRVDAIRAEAARQTAAAEARAARAQLVADVLASGDLVRYTLVGRRVLAGTSAQVLWSGSRGLVLSAAGLAAPPGGSTYQMWLATRSRTWSAGTFAPDERGAVTHAMPPGSLPAPGTATLLVTVEPEGGSAAPAGDVVLARPRPPAPTPPEAAQ